MASPGTAAWLNQQIQNALVAKVLPITVNVDVSNGRLWSVVVWPPSTMLDSHPAVVVPSPPYTGIEAGEVLAWRAWYVEPSGALLSLSSAARWHPG